MTFQSDDANNWREHDALPPMGDNSEVREGLPEIIDRYIRCLEAGHEVSPETIGALPSLQRSKAIQASLALGVARVSRQAMRESPLMAGLMLFVAIHSDNDFGRCTDGAARMAAYLGCDEKTARRTLLHAVERGGLRFQVRAGKPPAVWLPYVRGLADVTAFDVAKAIAPPFRSAGRPSKDGKTPGTICPHIVEKPRTSHDRGFQDAALNPRASDDRGFRKTPDTEMENPGHIVPDSNSSCTYLKRESEVKSIAARSSQEADLFAPAVELPRSIQLAIEGGTAKIGAANLVDAIRAASRRGVDPAKIQQALRKAVAASCKEAGQKDPTPGSILSRAVWYVERSDQEVIGGQPFAAPNGRATNISRDFKVPDYDPADDLKPWDGSLE